MSRAIAALLLATMLFSCNKIFEDSTAHDGAIQYTNKSSDSYKLFLEGSYLGSIDGGTSYEKKVSPGEYKVKVIQESGYLGDPIEKTAIMSIGDKEVKVFAFP
jgi:hypothetical protein